MAYQPKPYRKFLATTATAALVATAVSPVYAASFTDVSGNYKEAVDYLVSNKVTDGTSAMKFGTNLTIKRVDAAVMLAKTLKLKVEGVKDSGFTDVPTRAKAYVDALKAAGIVNGKTTKTFNSDQNITRGEMAIMLAKAYKITGNKAKLPFTDVAPRYQDSVAALVDHKITSGKTTKSFGTEQAIKRGEFAVFLYKLSKIGKEDPVITTTANVSNEADLLAALKNDKITKIILEANIASSVLPVISRNVEMDLNGKTLTGNLQYNLPNETESITLSSSKAGAYVQGNLSVNTPKADFIVGENVEILGTTTVVNVKASTFYNKGILNSVTVEDSDGTSFANKDHGMIRSKLAIEATGAVRLIGKIDSVVVNKPAGITVENAADVKDMLVTVNGVTVNAPSGTIETLRTPSGITVKNPEGQPVETKPETPSTGGGSGGGGGSTSPIDKAPAITGVEEGRTYNAAVTPATTDTDIQTVELTKDDVAVVDYALGTGITENGVYKLTVTDRAGKKTVINFTINIPVDNAPVITGVEEGRTYNAEVTPSTTDTDIQTVELTKDDVAVVGYALGTGITENGVYKLTVTDHAGKKTVINFTIDTIEPSAATTNPIVVVSTIHNDGKLLGNDTIKLSFSEPIENSGGEAIAALTTALNNTVLKDKVSISAVAGVNTDSAEFILTVNSEVDMTSDVTITLAPGVIKDANGVANTGNISFTVNKETPQQN